MARQVEMQRLVDDWVRFETALRADPATPWRGYDRRHQQGHLTLERARAEAFSAAMLAREYVAAVHGRDGETHGNESEPL